MLKDKAVRLLCYTRMPQEDLIYASKLANSVHLAYYNESGQYVPLNHNSGVLFAKAIEKENGSLHAKSLRTPFFFKLNTDGYGLLAVRTEADGEEDIHLACNTLLYTTQDFIQYQSHGIASLGGNKPPEKIACVYSSQSNTYNIYWMDGTGQCYENQLPVTLDLKNLSQCKAIQTEVMDKYNLECKPFIEGAIPGNTIDIPVHVAQRLIARLSVPENTENYVLRQITASNDQEIAEVTATAVYSDGSTAIKRVDWDTRCIDWSKSGTYEVCGTIYHEQVNNPIALHRADPCVALWKDKFYFIATDDSNHNTTLFIRQAESISALSASTDHLILEPDMYTDIQKFFWAPELHRIANDLYIFFACSPGEFRDIQSYVMKLKHDGDPTKALDWEKPIRVLKKTGSFLFEAGITLDMTCFMHNKKTYVIWAQRELEPEDLGSWLYIATIDENKPWQLTSEPVLISKPEFGWANNHTFVDEGPFALKTDKHIHVTFSSAATDATYCVGILTADINAELLDSNNWIKGNYPLLTSRSISGEFGPGHNSYIQNIDGNWYSIYHARWGIHSPRSTGIRRVHFDIDGYPILDLPEHNDVNPNKKIVHTTVIVPDTNSKL